MTLFIIVTDIDKIAVLEKRIKESTLWVSMYVSEERFRKHNHVEACIKEINSTNIDEFVDILRLIAQIGKIV